MKLLKAKEVLDIHRRYHEGEEPVVAIAASHKVNNHTVVRIGRGHCHAKITGQKPIIGNRQRLKLPVNLVDLYARYSLEMLAVEYGVTRATVRKELVRRGAKIRSVGIESAQLAVKNRGSYGQIYQGREV